VTDWAERANKLAWEIIATMTSPPWTPNEPCRALEIGTYRESERSVYVLIAVNDYAGRYVDGNSPNLNLMAQYGWDRYSVLVEIYIKSIPGSLGSRYTCLWKAP
jgi:hypothetical protein